MGTKLWIAEPTGTFQVALRRFRYSDDDGHRHEASVVIDENAQPTPPGPDGEVPIGAGRVSHDDPRWPSACGCGEAFTDDDRWQVSHLDWYAGTGGRFTWGRGSWDAIPGAMIRSSWRDADGRPPAWTVYLPNGAAWNTNDPASGDGGTLGALWEVTGEAPLITASPSIDDRDPARPWHGFIRNGEFIDA